MAKIKKTIGKIGYSLALRMKNPGNTESEKVIYPVAQENETVGLYALAQHIHEHNSTFGVGEIFGVLTELVSNIKEQLLAGNGVQLDGLGKFSISLRAEGTQFVEDFTTGSIKAAKVNFRTDSDVQSEINSNARFEYVGSRASQANAKADDKEAIIAVVGAKPVTDNSGGSDNTGGGNTGGGNTGGGNTGGGGDVTE